METKIIGNDRAVLYRGDCTRLTVAENAFDALITDPPYGMGYVSRHHQGRVKDRAWGKHLHGEGFAPIVGDTQAFDPAPWLTLAGKRPVVLWGVRHFAKRLPDGACGRLVWDKVKGTAPASQADGEMAYISCTKSLRIYSHLWRGLCRDGEENLSRGGRKLHPNQKPVALMDWVLDQCKVVPGQTVFDPYMGSASLGVACMRRGVNYIGCEIDEDYFSLSCKRLEAELDKVAASGTQVPPPAWKKQDDLFEVVT